MFAVSLLSLFPPLPHPPLVCSLSILPIPRRFLRAYTEHGRGIIFAVLPIQLCVRRKAAFNKSLIKGKQCGVVLSRAASFSFLPLLRARESVPPHPSSLLVIVLFLEGITGKTGPVGPPKKGGNTRKERDSKKDRSCHAPMAPPKSIE